MNTIEPSWDYYRTFLAVLRYGSLSAAARELGLTQPTVGRHIDALEQIAGLELFTRSPQGLLPKEAALELQPYAETLEATSAALLRVASGQRVELEGTVRISASDIVAVEVLPPVLAKLQEAHPGLVIELSPSNTVEDLLRRESDIAVRMIEPAQAALLVRRIGDIPLGLYAHRRYVERHGAPQKMADLAGHRIIGFDRQTTYIRTMAKRFPLLDGVKFAFKADSNLAQLAAIRAGLGIGICQIGLARNNPDLVRLLPGSFEIPLGTWLAMHENLKSSQLYRVTFDALVEGLQEYLRHSVGRSASG